MSDGKQSAGGAMEHRQQQQQPRKRREEDMDTRISKRLTSLLRHNAEKAGLAIRPDGYALVSDVLRCAQLDRSVDESKVLELVDKDKKSRFGTQRDDQGRLWIRANQGHTIAAVDRDHLLTPIKDASAYPVCIHGTTLLAWNSIKHTGLCRMKRNEIHCAKGEFGTVLSGFRPSTQVLVYINLGLCLEHGIPWFESENGVLLTPGLGEKGVIPTGYFTKVINAKTKEVLEFQPTFEVGEDADEKGGD